MKINCALVSLLPILGVAAGGQLPNIDVQGLSADRYEASAVEAADLKGEVNAAACPPNYPWLCAGRCCPYSICCDRECCNWDADFCRNGLCYKWV